ncbi:MAG: RnfABCDGE type electron transport complex subunit D [Lachnospiraceae bacterium]|nr:RnfABCDGE type electron transport complex subunit D [Lachnospiraceae bacterium]
MAKLLNVSSSPHVRSKVSTKNIMYDVAIAMVPALIWGVMQFGIRSLIVVAATVASCMLSEYAFEKYMKKPITITDGSALVTGMILGLNMPPSIPVWIPCLGGVFAIIIVKQLYGGLGQNWMNPALAARCFLLISFASSMTQFTDPATDAIASATPLAVMKSGGEVAWMDLFIGKIPGTIGEVSAVALLIGAAYLLYKKVISIRIPGTYILTFAIFAFIFGRQDVNYVLAQVFGGGLIFGAFFMATDYVTSPITPKGQIVFGICLGILTGLFRIFGGSAEGVSYAIIFCNILVPLIEKVTLPTAFGKGGKKNGSK